MIPVFKPSYGKEEMESVRGVLQNGWIGLGPKTQEFEERFAAFLRTPRLFNISIIRKNTF